MFAAVVMLGGAAAVVKLPRNVSTGAVVRSAGGTVWVTAPAHGLIQVVAVDGGIVKAGDVVVAIDASPTDIAHVQALRNRLASLPRRESDEAFLFLDDSHLPGEIRRQTGIIQEQEQIGLAARNLEVEQLRRDIAANSIQREAQERNLTALSQQIAVSRELWLQASKLFEAGLIARSQIAELEMRLIAVERERRTMEASLKNLRVETTFLRQAFTEALSRTARERQLARTRVRSAVHTALARVDEWCNQHVITAAVDGVVRLPSRSSTIRSVQQGEALLAIVRPGARLFLEMSVDEKEWPEVRVGQHVRMALNAYPPSRFGYLETSVASVSDTAREGNYLVVASLDSATGQVRPMLREGLTGAVLIRLGNETILQRVLRRYVR